MLNVNKYWIILESLNFPIIGASKDSQLGKEERLKFNLKVLQDNIKLNPLDIVESIMESLKLQHMENKRCYLVGENIDNNFAYSLYSVKMLLEISKSTNFSSDAKEDLVSERHKTLIISSIVDVAAYALQENLHNTFYKEKSVFLRLNDKTESNLFHLQFLMEALSSLIFLRPLHVGKSLDDVQLWYMASIFSLLIAFDSKEYSLEETEIACLRAKLQKMWLELSKKLYYRNLMLLYSSLPNAKRQRIYKEMLQRLLCPGGYQALVFAMADSQRSEEQSIDETVSNLVAQPHFSIKAQHSLLKQILQFLEVSIKTKEYSTLMGAAILSLKKLYDNNRENQDFIRSFIQEKMNPLIKADDVSKIVAMEWLNFIDLISLLYHIFCTSSVATLPSDLLVCYIPLFLELYSQIHNHANQKTVLFHLSELILRTLNNRTIDDLKKIIQCIASKKYPEEWQQLTLNIQIKENPLCVHELKLSIVENKVEPILMGYKHPLASLVAMLKTSSYTLLMYQHFLILLQMVPATIVEANGISHNENMDLLESEDVYNKILQQFSLIYEDKIQIVKALEVLVQHQPLKTIMKDNIKDLLAALHKILEAFTKYFSRESKETETDCTVLTILLILIREIVDSCCLNADELQVNLFKPIKQLEVQVQNESLKYQLGCLLKTMNGEEAFSYKNNGTSKDVFEEARSLIESHESFLQVQGIEMMIKLLNKRDEYAATNRHVLIALALNTLKSPESYTFLNCIRLFVALVNINEADVLEILSDEYLNDAADMDYRLVIGEAIIKTSREIGPLCYKYKNVLLNNFMAGCRSPLDDFRVSAFSNLSQMCRQLTYQVHNYFQELLNLIDCELTTGNYLPAKRAAVMVLSELLAGMDNLFDYEEMLLPIYRLLKHLVTSDKIDDKMRIHASNGLKCLSEKCIELFKTGLEQHKEGLRLEKQINILGIHDKPKRSLKNHILDMN